MRLQASAHSRFAARATSAECESVGCELIRQFVPVVWLQGKMRSQQFACFTDCMDDAFGKFCRFKVCGHFFCHLPPEFLAAAFVHALVAYYSQLTCAWGHINQYGIAQACARHAKFHERFSGRLDRVFRFPPAD